MQDETLQTAGFGQRVRAQTESETRLRRVEQMQETILQRVTTTVSRSRRMRRLFGISIIALVGVSALAVAAITTSTNNFSGAKSDVYTYDETKFAIVSQGMDVSAIAVSAAGNVQGSPIEMATTFGAANTAISAGDWFYEIDLKEAAIASVASGTFKAELFVDGVSKGALYVTQGTADATALEGVTLQWSLSSSLAANAAYVVKVTSV